MKNLLKVFRNSMFFLCMLFLFNGCSTNENNKNKTEVVTEKPLHAVDTVYIKQMQFNPAVLNVKIGDTILWINNDLVTHDVTSDKPNSFYSDTLHVGQSWKMPVKDSAGYHCSIHPTMLGKLVLK
jgi:plastocyanin